MKEADFDKAIEEISDFVEEYMEKFNASDEEIRDILDLVRQNWV